MVRTQVLPHSTDKQLGLQTSDETALCRQGCKSVFFIGGGGGGIIGQILPKFAISRVWGMISQLIKIY